MAALAVALLLQSTVLGWLAVAGVKPDVSLIVLVFIALRKGSMIGQVSGFLTGVIEDLLSLSPLGFHALIKTVLGYLYGKVRGNLFVDAVIAPVVLVSVATLAKGLLSAVLGAVFLIPAANFGLFLGDIWIELLYNGLLAPFLFALLRRIAILNREDKERT